MAAEGSLFSGGIVSGDLQPALAWLAALLSEMGGHLDKDCFRQAWGAAAAAINRYVRVLGPRLEFWLKFWTLPGQP